MGRAPDAGGVSGPDWVRLYTQAADEAEAAGDHDQACFYLTQAFVHALEAGRAEAAALNARLVAAGREAPL